MGRYVARASRWSPTTGCERSLHAAGLDSDVVETLTNASRPGWAWIRFFTWEAWELSDLIATHVLGWGSSALVAIRALLGVSPAVPTAVSPRRFCSRILGAGRLLGAVPTMSGTASLTWARSTPACMSPCRFPRTPRRWSGYRAGEPVVVESELGADRACGKNTVAGSKDGVVTLQVGTESYAIDVSGS